MSDECRICREAPGFCSKHQIPIGEVCVRQVHRGMVGAGALSTHHGCTFLADTTEADSGQYERTGGNSPCQAGPRIVGMS